MSDTKPERLIPEALGDENGEMWFIPGHIDPALAVLAVVVEQMVNVDGDAAEYLLVGPNACGLTCDHPPDWPHRQYSDRLNDADDFLRSVEHRWHRPNPANPDDENWPQCEADDPGAQPWTVVVAQ